MEPPCGLLLTSDFTSWGAAGLCGRPSIVLDGSSARVFVSERDCLVRQSGAVSAGLASASITRVDGGKMETGGRKREREESVSLLKSYRQEISENRQKWRRGGEKRGRDHGKEVEFSFTTTFHDRPAACTASCLHNLTISKHAELTMCMYLCVCVWVWVCTCLAYC